MCYAVFDGHNGFHISQFMADTFTSTLSTIRQTAESRRRTADTRQQTIDTLSTTPIYRQHNCTGTIGNTGPFITASQALSTNVVVDVLTGCFTLAQEQVLAQKIGGGSTTLAFWVTQIDDSDKENANHPRYVGLCANAGDSRFAHLSLPLLAPLSSSFSQRPPMCLYSPPLASPFAFVIPAHS
jgi:serine/threonine protein phosphatase PrpC